MHSMIFPQFGDKLYGYCTYASLKNLVPLDITYVISRANENIPFKNDSK